MTATRPSVKAGGGRWKMPGAASGDLSAWEARSGQPLIQDIGGQTVSLIVRDCPPGIGLYRSIGHVAGTYKVIGCPISKYVPDRDNHSHHGKISSGVTCGWAVANSGARRISVICASSVMVAEHSQSAQIGGYLKSFLDNPW